MNITKPLITPDLLNWHATCNVLGNARLTKDHAMTQPSLFAREDTLLGVCEGLGHELGLPSTLFRIAFAVGLFWNPLAMIVGYLVLGAALALFRWAFPPHRATAASSPAVPPVAGNDAGAVLAEAA